MLGKKDRKYINNFSKKCDCFLFTSLSEGFGLSLVEAMRDFKYVACSNIPVAHELITKDIDGARKQSKYNILFSSLIFSKIILEGRL